MCGILFIAGCDSEAALASYAHIFDLLNRRGPDGNLVKDFANLKYLPRHGPSEPAVPLTFYSSVLSLRGDELVQQPLQDAGERSLLCWNGEAWEIDAQRVLGNDTLVIQRGLLDAARRNAQADTSKDERSLPRKDHVAKYLASISGPFAVVFYDSVAARIYFARDYLGRRSLLVGHEPHCFALSSVSDGKDVWAEIDADGIYILHLASDSLDGNATHLFPDQAGFLGTSGLRVSHLPWAIYGRIPKFNHISERESAEPLDQSSGPVKPLKRLLVNSVSLRLGCRDTDGKGSGAQRLTTVEENTKFAILFSGGLDCSILARVIHDLLPLNEDIDLLNVAFENPRLQSSQNGTVESVYELCPDRITARKAHAELSNVCPRRVWRLVEIDVPFHETQAHRDMVLSLMYPHETEMDRSIALALYFAARGKGGTASNPDRIFRPYETPARILFSGLGADELFGGYQRHATAFRNTGFPGLLNALELDFTRLGKRNLGRDDRVISHWGKEARYPYLDESLVHWAVQAHVWEKCGFGQAPCAITEPFAATIEPGKQLLRLLALSLGMPGVACEKKRAIQFGARTAKMEGKSKGTQTVAKAFMEHG